MTTQYHNSITVLSLNQGVTEESLTGDLRAHLLNNPSMEERIFRGSVVPRSSQQRILVGEDGSILGDNVKKVHSAGFDCLGDVVIGWKTGENQ